MPPASQSCRLLAAALLLAVCASPLRGFAYEPRQPVNAGVFPVTVRAAEVPWLIGTQAINLSAFSCFEGKLMPVPVQVDEVNTEGRIASLDPRSRIARDDPPGILDADDEIVFMLRDTGKPCEQERLERARGTLTEIRITAPYLATPGILYLLSGSQPVAPPALYLRYDSVSSQVSTSAYSWGYAADRPFMTDRVVFADLRGRETQDVMDRFKLRVRVKAVSNLMQLRLNEDEMESDLEGVRAGPIRVTRELAVRVKTVPGFTIPAVVTMQHYERLWRVRVRLRIPGAAALFVNSLDMSLIHDFIDLKGLKLATSAVPQGTSIDGRMLDSERTMEFGSEPWFYIAGQGLQLMTSIDLEPGLKLKQAVYLVDDPELREPPESVPGGLPSVGYQFLGWENLEARWYEFAANIAMLPGLPEGGASGYYRALRAPMKIETRQIAAMPVSSP
ncbi:MAG: hypothetical protein KIT79_05715 [Deltaproteobacteria bacterium]|nr:hypothetical protein [Deltaproteobacteria bacterium]